LDGAGDDLATRTGYRGSFACGMLAVIEVLNDKPVTRRRGCPARQQGRTRLREARQDVMA
jgi:hypothetical protein